MTKHRAWRAEHFCRPLAIAGEIGLCLRPDQMDRGPAYSLYGVQVPRGTNLYASSGNIVGAMSAARAGTLLPCTYTT
jgi:hypothetical protein